MMAPFLLKGGAGDEGPSSFTQEIRDNAREQEKV